MEESGGSDGVVDSGEGTEYESAEYQIDSDLSSDSYSKEICSENREKTDSKKGLEELVKSDSLTTEELVKSLQAEEVKYVQEEIYTRDFLTDRIEHHHNWSLSNWAKTVSKYIKNANLIDGIKGFWYLILALTDNSRNESPFERIDKGAKYIFFPGYLAIPKDIELFEKHLGEKCAYVESTDTDFIKQVADYMVSKHGAVNFIGFSDGGKTIEKYISEYGMGNIQGIYAIATNPIAVNPREIGPKRYSHPRLLYILGGSDLIAPLESGYPENFSGVFNVEVIRRAGHTFLIQDKDTIKIMASIIKENSHAGKIYVEPSVIIYAKCNN